MKSENAITIRRWLLACGGRFTTVGVSPRARNTALNWVTWKSEFLENV